MPRAGFAQQMDRAASKPRRSHPFSAALWCGLVVIGSLGYLALHRGGVPQLGTDLPIEQKKQQFLTYLKPHIQANNTRLGLQRELTLSLYSHYNNAASGLRWTPRDDRLVQQLATAYKVDMSNPVKQQLNQLVLRVDAVPTSMALAQAAIESGWGQSWLAQKANNIFGRHCFRKGCGVEHGTVAGSRFAQFRQPALAVQTHADDLNTHYAYQEYRKLRAEARELNQPLSGTRLADGLLSYSIRGNEYVQQIKAFIAQQDLEASPSDAANELPQSEVQP